MQKNEIQENAYREVKNGEYKNPEKVPKRYMSRFAENALSALVGIGSGWLGFCGILPISISLLGAKGIKNQKDRKYGKVIDGNFPKRVIYKASAYFLSTWLALSSYGAYELHQKRPQYYEIPTKTQEISLECNRGLPHTSYESANILNILFPYNTFSEERNYADCTIKGINGEKITFYVTQGSAQEKIKKEAVRLLARIEAENKLEQLRKELEQKYREML